MSDKKWVALVVKLNQLTREGKLVWRSCPAPPSLYAPTHDAVQSFHVTDFNGKKIGIYEVRRLSLDDYHDRRFAVSRAAMALFNDSMELEYELPNVAGIGDLLDTVRYYTAGVRDWLDSSLAIQAD